MLAARGLSFAHDARVLLQGAQLSVDDGERVALVGKNGAGKSTLLAILAGTLKADDGIVERGRGQSIGVLTQEPHLALDATVADVARTAGAKNPHLADHRIEEVLSRLGVVRLDARVGDLSGGQRRRLDLARLLLEEPDILLLDEPTNHLDAHGIRFLGETLRRHRGPVIVISHDRAFLDEACTRVVELDRGAIHSYGTPQDSTTTLMASYLEQKLLRDEVASKTQHRQERLYLRELAWLRAGTPARTTKQQARIQRAEELATLVESEAAAIRDGQKKVQLEREQTRRLGKTILDLQNVTIARGDDVLFADLNLVVTRGQRWGILGDNGSGKTTLLKAIATACGADLGEHVDPTDGRIVVGDNTTMAVFDQHRRSLDPEATLEQVLSGKNDHVIVNGERVHISGYLERFLFDGSDRYRRCKTLSGGEQNRLVLARLFLSGANVLLLDEPTNDLDVTTLGVLEETLLAHDGCAFVVSHDRRFLDRVVTGILAFEPPPPGSSTTARHVVVPVLGDYTHYERTQARRLELTSSPTAPASSSSSLAAASPASTAVATDAMAGKAKKKRSYKEEQEFNAMEETILARESRRDDVRALLEDGSLFRTDAGRAAALTAELSGLDVEIERLYARWAELSELPPM